MGAIVVGDRSNGSAYEHSTAVELSNTTVISQKSEVPAIYTYQKDSEQVDRNVTINGGENAFVSGTVSNNGMTGLTITGGTFTDPQASAFIDDTTSKVIETEDGVIVVPNTEGVTLDSNKQTLKVGESVVLHATLTPEGAVEELVWTSSDPTIVTVDANGTMTAVKEGSATITVTAGTYSAQCEVTVVAAEEETQEPTTPPSEDEKDPSTPDDGVKEPTTNTKPAEDTKNPETGVLAVGGLFASMAVLSAGIVIALWKKRTLSEES